MAKAIRSDLLESPRWVETVALARGRLEAFHPEKCPNCETYYTMIINLTEDSEEVANLLRARFPEDCPEHPTEIFIINEGRIDGQIAR